MTRAKQRESMFNTPRLRRWPFPWLLALALAVGCLVAGCGGSEPETESAPAEEEDVLLEITLSPEQVAAAGVETVEVSMQAVGEPLELPGRVVPETDREAYVTSLLAGRLDAVFAAPGDAVRAGQPVARVTSPALGGLVAELKRTRTELERQVRLAERNVGIRKNLEAARTDYEAARQDLLAVGFGPEQVEGIATGEAASAGLTLTAPISGYVLERNAVLGGPVSEGDRLFYLAALSPILVVADAYERDLLRLQTGQEVTVSAPADPLRRLGGRIADIVPQVDPERRALSVRVEVPNRDGFLKPGMYATVVVPAGAGPEQLALPADAIRSDAEGAFVLVARTDTTFERVAVAAPVGASGFVAVPELAAGTRVVTVGGYQIVSAMKGVEADDD